MKEVIKELQEYVDIHKTGMGNSETEEQTTQVWYELEERDD